VDKQIKQYLNNNWCIIPIPPKSKIPAISWRKYNTQHPTEEEISKWFPDAYLTNVALVCGKISGGEYWHVVLDLDSIERYDELKKVIEQALGLLRLEDYTLVAKASRGYHIHWYVKQPVRSQNFRNLEIKSDGALALLPPSQNDHGNHYEWLNYKVTSPLVINSLKDIGIDVNQPKPDSPSESNHWINQALQGVPEGQRDDTCTKLAGYFLNQGIPPDVVKTMLYPFAEKCEQSPGKPFTTRDVDKTVDSIWRKENTKKDNNSIGVLNNTNMESHRLSHEYESSQNVTESSQRQRIKDWIYEEPGRRWKVPDLDEDLNLKNASQKHIRSVVISEEKTTGGIIPERWRGYYRTVDFVSQPFQLKNIASVQSLPIKLPLGIERQVQIFKGMTIVVAGDTGAGKTAFTLHTVKLNDSDNLFVLISEMGEDELKARLSPYGQYDWKATFIPRDDNFADIIRPEAFTIVDWLAVESDFWQVRNLIKDMRAKLNSGLLMVNIQKGDDNKKYGEGGRFSAHYAHLYITLDKTKTEGIFKATIQKATFPVDPNKHPKGMSCNFTIERGCKLEIERDWEHEKYPEKN